nr:unnamed protein product [Callosobruchus analis]
MTSTEKSINQLTAAELKILMQQANNTQTEELKKQLSISIKAITDTVAESKDRINKIETSVKQIERKLRRNNIVIFGLQIKNKDNLLLETLDELKNLLSIDLTPGDINNIFQVDTEKSPIILEFISLLKKQLVFKQVQKLKGTGVAIANDQSHEDRQLQKELVHHLKQAKQQNLHARIRGTRLEVSNRLYTIDELKSIENGTFEDSADEVDGDDGSAPDCHHAQQDKIQEEKKRKRAKLQYSPKARIMGKHKCSHDSADRESLLKRIKRLEKQIDWSPTTSCRGQSGWAGGRVARGGGEGNNHTGTTNVRTALIGINMTSGIGVAAKGTLKIGRKYLKINIEKSATMTAALEARLRWLVTDIHVQIVLRERRRAQTIFLLWHRAPKKVRSIFPTLLESLDFIVNYIKGQLIPTQECGYLGFTLDTIKMEIRPPKDKCLIFLNR